MLALVLLAAGCGVAQAQSLIGGLLGVGKASQASSPAAPAPESPSAAYARLCAPGAATLSATTCLSMQRDIDGGTKPDSEAAKAYRELCTPSAPKLSRETCAAMKLDAAGPPAKRPIPSRTIAPPRNAGAELRSAHAELCLDGEPQVSAETCGSLAADAASKSPRPAAKPKRK